MLNMYLISGFLALLFLVCVVISYIVTDNKKENLYKFPGSIDRISEYGRTEGSRTNGSVGPMPDKPAVYENANPPIYAEINKNTQK